jgi:hypothetical protein
MTSCSASLMTSAEGACELSSFHANHTITSDLVDMPESIYMEKSCLPAVLLVGVSKVFPAVPNKILVGHVLEVADAASLEQCQLACLRSERDHGFICQSAMWYPNDNDQVRKSECEECNTLQNCLLNSESRLTLPDVFVPEEDGVNMVYLEIPRDSLRMKTSLSLLRLKVGDDLPAQEGIAGLADQLGQVHEMVQMLG